jgi:hypothetical protein
MIKIYDDGSGKDEVILKCTLSELELLLQAAMYSVGGMSEQGDYLIPQMCGVLESYLFWDCSIDRQVNE